MSSEPLLTIRNLDKAFHLHEQRVRRPVLGGVSLELRPGECVAIEGRSGAGKSSLLRAVYGNYVTTGGEVLVRTPDGMVDVASADPWTLLQLRRTTMGYVSQFLRVLPRVSALEIVAEPLVLQGVAEDDARRRARAMLAKVNLPEALWGLSPLTFSGGEQQRVNIARGFIRTYPILLVDEPTASLDAGNRQTVIGIIREALANGAAILGIFHDEIARQALASRSFNLEAFATRQPTDAIAMG